MTEKVKLTQEQADAVERRLTLCFKPESIVRFHAQRKWENDQNLCLNELSLDTLTRALYIGYEVEPKFEIGDWVYVEPPKKELPNVYKIMVAERHSVNLDRLYGNHKKSDIRHATSEEIEIEKERRWWASHDREVRQLKRGDILTNNDNGIPFVVTGVGNDYIIVNHAKDVGLEIVKDNYEVASFIRDRLDVKTDG